MGESGVMTFRKPNVGPTGVRRDASEKSQRWSRSPSTRLNQSKVIVVYFVCTTEFVSNSLAIVTKVLGFEEEEEEKEEG